MQIYNYTNMQSNNDAFNENKKNIKKYKYLSRHIHNVLI